MNQMQAKSKNEIQTDESLTLQEERELYDFILLEAQYADESRYTEWESLWVDDKDACYWVPMDHKKMDPNRHSSLLYDNRARIATRIRQLNTGNRWAQIPPSPMRRVISNMIYRRGSAERLYEVESNFILVELAVQSTHNLNIFAGRTLHIIRREADNLKLHTKRIMLVNSAEPISSIAFII